MQAALVRAAVLLVFLCAPLPSSAEQKPIQGLDGVKLLQVTLPSRDLTRSVAFYRDILGLRLLFEVPGAAFFNVAGVRLRLEASTSAPSQGAELYFDDPLLSKASALAARGVKFVSPAETVQRNPMSDLKLLEFLDPDGNALALMGEVPH